jgi:hypothetical protein
MPVAPSQTYTGYTVSYSPSELYFGTPTVGRFLDFWVPRTIPPDASDKLYIIKRQDWVQRPDLIAYDTYGDDALFWVFGVRNGLADLVFDILYGSVLFFPTSARLAMLGIGKGTG